MKRRVTIADIAERAGVSIGAVSFALNGRQGVSEETRSRVLAVAAELNWAPSSTARALMAAKTQTVGMVIVRDPRQWGDESFYMQFIAGIESELSQRDYALMLQLAPTPANELSTLTTWAATRRVDGVILVDARVDDSRWRMLSQEGSLPAVVSVEPTVPVPLMNVWSDHSEAMRQTVRELRQLGHRRLARIAGNAEFLHTHARDAAFAEATSTTGDRGLLVHAGYSMENGYVATLEVLESIDRPTAIIYDNVVMTIGGLRAARDVGVSVPGDVSLVAWDDSLLCQYSEPPLSAVHHNVFDYGVEIARAMFAAIDGEPPISHLHSTPTFVSRGSTGPAPRA